MDFPPTPVLENPENQTLWYCKYFLGEYHNNFVGQELNDGEKSTYVLSLVEEISFGKTHCRCIMWAKNGPKRLVIAGSFKSKSLRHILAQFGYSGSRIDQSPKQVRNLIYIHINSKISHTVVYCLTREIFFILVFPPF